MEVLKSLASVLTLAEADKAVATVSISWCQILTLAFLLWGGIFCAAGSRLLSFKDLAADDLTEGRKEGLESKNFG